MTGYEPEEESGWSLPSGGRLIEYGMGGVLLLGLAATAIFGGQKLHDIGAAAYNGTEHILEHTIGPIDTNMWSP